MKVQIGRHNLRATGITAYLARVARWIVAARQSRDDQSKRRFRRLDIRGVISEVRKRRVEFLRRRRNAVTAFGDHHRHDADFGFDRNGQRGRGIARLDEAEHRSGHARGGAMRLLLDNRRQIVLLFILLPHRLVGAAHACTDDRPVVIDAEIEEAV